MLKKFNVSMGLIPLLGFGGSSPLSLGFGGSSPGCFFLHLHVPVKPIINVKIRFYPSVKYQTTFHLLSSFYLSLRNSPMLSNTPRHSTLI